MQSISEVEQIINNLLQRNVTFSINNKIVKTGKLILISIKEYYIIFTMLVGSAQKKYELPLPFHIEFGKTFDGRQYLIFDYQIESIAQSNQDILIKMQTLNVKFNKLHNNQVTILEL
jgi:hypothetical protein